MGARLSRSEADYRISLVNQPGKDATRSSALPGSWCTSSKRIPSKSKKMVEFLDWSLHKGQRMAAPMLYAPLPDSVQKMVEKTIKTIK